MLNDPVARQAYAREIAQASMPKGEADPRDVLSEFDRTIVGGNSVQLRIPLRDPVEVRRHLEMIEETCRTLRLRMQQQSRDRSHLIMVRGVMRILNKKLNAYRTPRND